MVIRGTDRVNQVIARGEHLIDVFVDVSPAFARLRMPALRRTMTRLVTVEQAARIAGVSPALLLERLNHALEPAPSGTCECGGAEARAAAPEPWEDHPMTTETRAIPALLRDLAERRIVDVDVRADLRSGREPFSRIMEARRSLAPGEVLRLRAIFEPVPLYTVFAKQGFEHWTERLADDDWQVWFYPARPAAAPRQGEATAAAGATPPEPTEDEVEVLDVRGLEPPEPMMATLAALDRLPRGRTLVQINVRVPQFLLPQLEARGFSWEVRAQEPELVRLFIRHRAEQ